MTEFKPGDRVTLTKGETTITTTLTLGGYGDTLVQSAPGDPGASTGYSLPSYQQNLWYIEEAKPTLPTVPGSVIYIEDDDFYVLDASGDTWGSSMNAYDIDDLEDEEFKVIFVNKKIVEDAPVENA